MTRSPFLSRRRFLAQSARAAASVTAIPLLTFEDISMAENPGPSAASTGSQKQSPVTRILADWVVNSHPADIPSDVRKEAVRSIVNSIGATVGGSTSEAVECALRALSPYSGPHIASVFGRSQRLDPPRAALINGISSHVLDYDDTDLKTIIHPAGLVASALFSLSADHRMSGAEFLHAFVLGTEVECRLGDAIYPSHYQMGWHITATCGVFGAAAACGKILGLSSQHMTWALGIAAAQAAGLKIMFGTMCKSFQVGRAAENGLLAALFAAQGFTSSGEALEGKDGYIDAASLQHDDSKIILQLGEHYEISQDTYKPFACGIVIHPAIDGAIQLREEHHLRPEDIESVVVRANPLVLQLTGKKAPQSGLEGKFSVYHSVAVALVRGHAGPADYSDQAVRNPQIVALRSRVQVIVDPAIHPDEAYVTVTTKDGHIFSKHVLHALGSLERPMSNADLDSKFRQLANGVLPEQQANRLLSMSWNIEALPNVAVLPRAARLQKTKDRARQVH